MYCKKCGKQLDDDAVFCPACGTAQSPGAGVNPEQAPITKTDVSSKKKSFNKWLLIIPLVVLLIGVGIWVAFWIGRNKTAVSNENQITSVEENPQDPDTQAETAEETTKEPVKTEDLIEEEPETVMVEKKVRIREATATSYLVTKSQDGQTYEPDHLIDDLYDTAWIEGKNDLGIGESVTLRFDRIENITRLLIYNGFLNSKYRYGINGKVTKLQVEFDDGTSKTISVETMTVPEDKVPFSKDEMHPTELILDHPITASEVKLTILDAVAGTKYDDVCISEIELYHEVEEAKKGADEHFYDFLRGNETDANGNLFWAIGEDNIEYALYDLNGDGINELLVRAYGEWIFDVLRYQDDKIRYANVNNLGSSGETFINNKNQFVSTDTVHQGRNYYSVSEIGEPGNAKVVLFLANYYDDWAASGSPEYYKKENPSQHDLEYEEYDPITKEEYDSLVKEYTQVNTSIQWKGIDEIPDTDTPDHEVAVGEDSADAKLTGYINGTEKDASGQYFQKNDDDKEIDYALYDLNGDGINELLIRRLNKWDSRWVHEVVQYKKNKIERVIDPMVYTWSYINTKNQYVDRTMDVIDNDYYLITEIDAQGNVKVPLFFAWIYDDETDSQRYYKAENLQVKDYPDFSEWVEITESEFQSLQQQYTQENMKINWK